MLQKQEAKTLVSTVSLLSLVSALSCLRLNSASKAVSALQPTALEPKTHVRHSAHIADALLACDKYSNRP